MIRSAWFELGLRRQLALIVVGFIVVSTATAAYPQAATTPVPSVNVSKNPANISGTWQGALQAANPLRLVVKIGKTHKGEWKATMYSIDQKPGPIDVNSVTLNEDAFKLLVFEIGGVFEGILSADGNSIEGKWTQGSGPLPLTLVRATKKTAWAIPAPSHSDVTNGVMNGTSVLRQ